MYYNNNSNNDGDDDDNGTSLSKSWWIHVCNQCGVRIIVSFNVQWSDWSLNADPEPETTPKIAKNCKR